MFSQDIYTSGNKKRNTYNDSNTTPFLIKSKS